jgi:hypothetical protein
VEGNQKHPVELSDEYALPSFRELDGAKPFADLRVGWNALGLYIWLSVFGKKSPLQCRKTHLLDSDGLQFWVDTRHTVSVQRATRFCHWFVLLPREQNESLKPLATMLKINRAKENSPSINQVPIPVVSRISRSGYQLGGFIPAACITGWDTNDHRLIGFSYNVFDRELGVDGVGTGIESAAAENPSLWKSLLLVG